ncbi:MAG: cytochrome c5 family protein [Neptuniibacter caesariensis]|uniref:Cytochrome c5 family protein n=1 Tax=Neptuniibacter caesariensis TaxID=207954 RepID=A0A2G6JKT3_NEPCE|nr:MAG: cytochrome c5 family protein [Neptuniibacter caesariensis]
MKRILTAVVTAILMLPTIAAANSIYNTKCVACHATGAAGAPKLGDVAAWTPRAALGMDVLLATVKAGKGAMPPKGLCNDCSDDDFKGAIQFMLDNSK